MFILKYGFIFESARCFIKSKATSFNKTLGIYIEKLLECSQCLGFWCGFILFLLANFLEDNYNLLIFYSILFGFISSITCYISDLITGFLDEMIYKLQQENEQKKSDKN